MRKLLKPLARSVLAALLGTRPRADLAMRAVSFPRFAEWCRRHPCAAVPGAAYSDRPAYFEKVLALARLTEPIDYLEFGVYQGKSLRWWCDRNREPGSRFFGFDSFRGLPETVDAFWHRGQFSTDGAAPAIDDDRVHIVAGWFHRTLPRFMRTFDRCARLVVHFDADIYSSTAFVLSQVGVSLRAGDVLHFDEFSDSIHEFRAFLEFTSFFGLGVRAVAQQAGFERTVLIVESTS